MYKLYKIQEETQKAIGYADRPLIHQSVRSGKTLAILSYLPKGKHLWVTENKKAQEGFYLEIKKWGIKADVECILYQSLKKHVKKSYDHLILDECHKITEGYLEYINQIKFKKLIAMTGTLPNNQDKKDLFDKLGLTLVMDYSIKDAINDKNVAPYKITFLDHNLDVEPNIKISYVKNGKPNTFYISEQQDYKNISRKIEEYKYHKDYDNLKKYAILRIKKLNSYNSIVPKIRAYINSNKNKRVLIFVENTDIASQFKYHYNSKSDDKYFKLFQEQKIPYLVLVNKAATGVTYENMDGCLLTVINKSNTNLLQKIFRTVLYREGYVSEISILRYNNTIHEQYINDILNDL